MNNDAKKQTVPPSSPSQSVDTSGKPVDVVKRDLEDGDDDTRAIDEVITPTSTRTKEQDAETLQKTVDEIERKVADSN
ncbi:hypothetical protein ACIPO9_23660 [Pseudomonas sp. NPDC090203]|uniref:hypothetical protein n=1 Tax=Pseudomonas sp. NPDC090203 TaxID=3364477 RepID=UPI00380879D0